MFPLQKFLKTWIQTQKVTNFLAKLEDAADQSVEEKKFVYGQSHGAKPKIRMINDNYAGYLRRVGQC